MTGKHLTFIVWTVAGAVAALAAAALALGLRINTTASVPVGLWAVETRGSPERGQIVSLCPPDTETFRQARAKGYIPHGRCPGGYEPLFKPIAAVPGDGVTVGPNGISVNGEPVPNTAPLALDRAGHTLPILPPGRYTVAPGEVWVLSSLHPKSFDSRYFGPLPVRHIQGVIRPLWVREGP